MERVHVDIATGITTIEQYTPAEEATRLAEIEAGLIVRAAKDAEHVVVVADREEVRLAISSLQAFIDRTSPTTAQTVAAVKLIARVCIILIRRALRVD
jgi:hypothetical protein